MTMDQHRLQRKAYEIRDNYSREVSNLKDSLYGDTKLIRIDGKLIDLSSKDYSLCRLKRSPTIISVIAVALSILVVIGIVISIITKSMELWVPVTCIVVALLLLDIFIGIIREENGYESFVKIKRGYLFWDMTLKEEIDMSKKLITKLTELKEIERAKRELEEQIKMQKDVQECKEVLDSEGIEYE